MATLVPSSEELKNESETPEQNFGYESDDNTEVVDAATGRSVRGYTRRDEKDMRRMGKQQELMRNFRRVSSFSFTVMLTATWEYLLIANTQGLTNGGLAGLWWSFVWSFFLLGLIMLSLAEMASMAPTSGGQYHWVSEFAPPKYQKPLSYLTGWMSALSWQAGNASGSYLTGSLIQALITINNPAYDPTNWHGMLLMFSMVLVLFLANVFGAKKLPVGQNFLVVMHCALLVVFVAMYAALAPHVSAADVFTTFTNDGNWASMGLSLMIGQITAIYSLVGSDAIAHMAEEVKSAGLSVPSAMIWSYILNGILAMFILLAYLFTLTSPDDALNDPTDYPYIWALKQALPDSTRGVTALTVLILLLIIAANIDYNAATARQTWSFARDKGFPGHRWIAAVHPTLHVPVNSIMLTCLITCLLALINIGSSIAFNAIISLQLVALMFSYTVSIGCVLHRRLTRPDLLPKARWSLGRWGVPVNAAAVTYAVFAFFWSFWPAGTPVDTSNMNYGVVMFGGVGAMCVVSYWVQGRHVYKGPVATVIGREGDA
ncbi:amino acid/polyamine transporter I [Mycena rosella]|uniref:Amino acid/polyamine transporter I n=1 Tax=Mycena rosella TaxID=1033263 RepID=A0AAD7D6K2_MYCRO|nr:amino acid/polyamine transporter I [Mycena rosella]